MSWLRKALTDPWSAFVKEDSKKRANTPTPEEIVEKKKGAQVPVARSTEAPDQGYAYSFMSDKSLVEPGFQFEMIPLLRKLSYNNYNVGQALQNIVSLANTGHNLYFDSSVKQTEIVKMKKHLNLKANNWQMGIAGTHGLANKLLSQAMIAGANATEAVIANDLSGVHRVLMPYPETIRFLYNKATMTYEAHQTQSKVVDKPTDTGFIKLNKNSFRYFAINGDSEKPYGIPPYLTALGPLIDQKHMRDNISFIVKQIGVIGFLELLVDKPQQNNGESDGAYASRLDAYLSKNKKALDTALSDGIVAGFQEDHEFKFHSTAKSAAGVSELYNNNELAVSNGLKQDAALLGRGQKGAESSMTIIFTKLISELKNIQICVAQTLQFVYELELRLAGFKFDSLEVEFKPSTVQDDLKMQQALEIKIRNLRQLVMDGVISQDNYAEELGYEKPHQQEPVVPYAPEPSTGDPNLDAKKKKVREESKDKSDRRSRDRNKPRGTTKPK